MKNGNLLLSSLSFPFEQVLFKVWNVICLQTIFGPALIFSHISLISFLRKKTRHTKDQMLINVVKKKQSGR